MHIINANRQEKRKLSYFSYEHLYQFDTKSIPNHNTMDIDFVHFNYLHSSFLIHFPPVILCNSHSLQNHLNFLSHSLSSTLLSMKP